jgi:hypothetical protein
MTDIFGSKSSGVFSCKNCDYLTYRKSQYERHILTSKHQNTYKILTNTDIGGPKSSASFFICDCGKKYKHRQSLFNHKKNCNKINNIDSKNNDLVEYLIKENSEFKNIILEALKNGSIHNSNNIINNNSNNKSFNLQFFLNETCKDAMNMTAFIDSLQLQLSDLENIGEVGFVEGISNIIIKNLNALDVTLRPVHCTDKKRETMYIKDQDIWEKEDEIKSKMHKVVKRVANKNIKLITQFQELHPEWRKSTSKVSDQFNKIVIEAMGGKGDNDFEKEEKIIKKVAKEVLIDKIQNL